MDKIARSVVTGEALEEIHVKYVDEHVHYGRALARNPEQN
jgi:hypothetical protein